jgi:hypothetical protein
MVARIELRRRRLGTLVAMLLVGFVATLTLAAVAGARRSASALRRFDTATSTSNLDVLVSSYTPAQLAAVRDIPGVEGVGVVNLMFVQPTDPRPELQHLNIAAADDAGIGASVDRPRLVAGRLANPNAPLEIDIGQGLASIAHLQVGSFLDIHSLSPADLAAAKRGAGIHLTGPHPHLRVVGIVRRPLDLASMGSAGGVVILTPAFTRVYAPKIANPAGFAFRLRARDPSAVTAALRKIFAGDPAFAPQDLSAEVSGARDSINVITDVLLIFAAIAAIAGIVAIAIVLSRELAITSGEQSALRSLGSTRNQRAAMSGARIIVIAAGGALLGIAGAIAASPLLPFGVARQADPDPGLHADWLVLGPGAIGVLIVAVAIGCVAAARSARVAAAGHAPRRQSFWSRVAAGAGSGLSPAAATGVHMATEPGRGKSAVPLRSAAFGATFGVLGVTTILVFTANLGHFAATPREYGDTFDFWTETTNIQQCNAPDAGISRMPGVASDAVVCYTNLTFAGRPTFAWAAVPVKGTIAPELVTGRPPTTPVEVALGAATLRSLGKHVGDTVSTTGPHGRVVVDRIVGEAVFPELGDPQPVAEGAWFTPAGWSENGATTEEFTRYIVGTYAPHADPAAIGRAVNAQPGTTPVTSARRLPVEISRLRDINWFPRATATLLAILALIAIAHALVTGTRRRRRDLAVLKTLGFVRAQVRHTVGWEATTLAVVGLVVGIPIGLVAGSALWRAIADSVGVPVALVVPAGLFLLIPAAILVVNAIALAPARSAARLRPAVALRSE